MQIDSQQIVCFGPGVKGSKWESHTEIRTRVCRGSSDFLNLENPISAVPENSLLGQLLIECYQTTSVHMLLGLELKLPHLESQAHRFVPNTEIFIV